MAFDGLASPSKSADKALIEPGGKSPDLPHAAHEAHLIDAADPSGVVVEGSALLGRVIAGNNPRPRGELARVNLVAHQKVVAVFDPGDVRAATKAGVLRALHRPLADQVGERGQTRIDSCLRHLTTSYVMCVTPGASTTFTMDNSVFFGSRPPNNRTPRPSRTGTR